MTVTVIVPTYRRPKDLARCLEALQKQTRPADEVIVVVRDTDTETWTYIDAFNLNFLPLRTVKVKVPGVVAAMNAGLDSATGDIVAFTDDDAAPHPDWLARIETHFQADERVGGVGGRDWVYHGTRLEDGQSEVVGQLSWFGRTIGNHHIGTGEAREVDILKGVNMSFRRAAIKELHFDQRMRGTGAQVHFEVAFCLTLKRAGWKLIYDPKIAVNHYPAQRFDEDQRNSFNGLAVTNAVHNETLALLEHLSPTQKFAFFFWSTFVGTRDAMGFIQWLRFLPSDGFLAGRKLLASLQGRWQGWRTSKSGYRV
ncbi:MAG: glycosyltransferase family A protein [Scytonema sp. PMC 1069.18]|nr:glycosyltransferase family A protein [Scytonema sp. PMC 1069.18]MEC4881994.1 glycosyltransferase family A protein [Scytonema sp. PMC 1070.18]